MEERKELELQIQKLKELKSKLKEEVIELDDKILFQDFGVYSPQYSFASSDLYKEALNQVRNEQKEMIKNETAATCSEKWKIQGSEAEGKKFIAAGIKQIIKNFNIECDLVISKVKFNNIEVSKKRIIKSFDDYNQINISQKISLSTKYLILKIKEMNIAYEYSKKKQEEKEERRLLREQQLEEVRVAREIEEKRRELEKERIHYQNANRKIDEQLAVEKGEERKIFLLERKKEINNNLIDIDKAMVDLDYREANHRAGYVYIISNIGAFGENIFKIGMTRRLEPEDRIAELSGASVPFKFDIHAMIFSDDAPKLEAALHHTFADKKVNLVNSRKEFFRVTLDEIKKAVRENFDKTVDFINEPPAQQYRETVMIQRKIDEK